MVSEISSRKQSLLTPDPPQSGVPNSIAPKVWPSPQPLINKSKGQFPDNQSYPPLIKKVTAVRKSLLIGFIVVAVLIAVWLLWAQQKTEKTQNTAQESTDQSEVQVQTQESTDLSAALLFLQYIKSRKYDKAYLLTSKYFQMIIKDQREFADKVISSESYLTKLKMPSSFEIKRNIDSSEAIGEVIDADGEKGKLQVILTRENNDWKIVSIHIWFGNLWDFDSPKYIELYGKWDTISVDNIKMDFPIQAMANYGLPESISVSGRRFGGEDKESGAPEIYFKEVFNMTLNPLFVDGGHFEMAKIVSPPTISATEIIRQLNVFYGNGGKTQCESTERMRFSPGKTVELQMENNGVLGYYFTYDLCCEEGGCHGPTNYIFVQSNNDVYWILASHGVPPEVILKKIAQSIRPL